jgi:hypothetical protein
MRKNLPLLIVVFLIIVGIVIWLSKDQLKRIGCPCWDGNRNVCLAREACE